MTIDPQPTPRQRRAPAPLGLLLAGPLLAGLGACGPGAPEVPEYTGPYRHLLLISLDTTRADHLGCYGGSEARTPRLDALAEGGVRFAEATAAAPTTLSSHTSIMTGLYPRRHGVPRNGFEVNAENVMLAEALQARGFHTAGFAGSFALDEMFGFSQGFDHWDQEFTVEFDPQLADQNQRPADQVTDAALEYLAGFDGSQRLFLFVHYFDVHSPYAPPEPFASSYMRQMRTSTLGQLEAQVAKHQERLIGRMWPVYHEGLTRELAERADGEVLRGDKDLSALYAGELAFVDREVGRLLDGLEERGVLEECLVVLTADHGETFWEHGDFWHHGAWVYETNVHVPLVLRLPDGRGAGRVVQRPVSSIDIYPTLLELLEVPLPEPVDGLSLVAAIDGEALPARAIFAEATQPTAKLEDRFTWANQLKTKSIRKGRWKLIQAPYLRFEELYDLETDPEERKNLLLDPTPEVRKRYAQLRAELDAWREVERPRASEFNARQRDDVLKRLAELGYTGELLELDEQD